VLQFAIVFFLVTFGVMVFMRIGMNKPGDPALTMLGGTVKLDEAQAVNARYHLNGNYFSQYWFWLEKMFRGDFGISVQQNTTVAKYLSGRVLVTMFLGFYAVLWALIIAIPVAVYQAYKRDSRFDRGGNFMSFLFVSLPPVVLAPFIILLFVVKLGFIIGDGRLRYGPELLGEIYYRLALTKEVSLIGTYQPVLNPAFNRDRGPVQIFTGRAHIAF
jgi:peptide/nickel transport system permease protein